MQPISDVKQRLRPILRFTPYAWAKLLFMCYSRDTEVSGMGIGAVNDPMTVEDILLIKQRCNSAFTKFDSDDYANKMLDLCDPEGAYKLTPDRCQRIWIHTHPAGIGTPSNTDDQTFENAFGLADWAIMFIHNKSKDVYCQLRITTRSAGALSTEFRQELPVEIAWDKAFPAADPTTWAAELEACVSEDSPAYSYTPLTAVGVMPVVRAGVVHPAPPPRQPDAARWLTTPAQGSRKSVTPTRSQKSRLVPVSGSLLSGLSSQQLTRLLNSDISKESLTTGGILPKLEKMGWALAEIEVTPEDNIQGNKSTVWFTNSAFPGVCFGNRDIALADRMLLLVGSTGTTAADLERAEFDLQAVAEERTLGEVGQTDSYGLAADALYPWHVPGRALLYVSVNELEELLLTIDAAATSLGYTETPISGLSLVEQRSLHAKIDVRWRELREANIPAADARPMILAELTEQYVQLKDPLVRRVVSEWVEEEVYDNADGRSTQELDLSDADSDMEKAKGVFLEILVKANQEGWTVPDINAAFANLYDKALQGGWLDEFIILLTHVRDNGFDPDCFSRPLSLTPKTVQMLEEQ